MSATLSQVAVEAFDTKVKQAYQGMSKLQDTVTQRSQKAGVYYFRRQGKGLANPHNSQAEVIPMGVEHVKIPCILEGWNAPEYTDIFDQSEVNFSELSTLAFTVAEAIGRRQDQFIINAAANLVPESGTGYAYDVVAARGANTAMNIGKLRQASSGLSDSGVPSGDRYIVINYRALEQLLGTYQVASYEYDKVKALIEGSIDYFLGFKFRIIETREEGGLPSTGTGNELYAYAYHKSALGLVTSIAPTTQVNFVAERNSYLTNGLLNGGAVAIDSRGIVRIAFDPTVEI